MKKISMKQEDPDLEAAKKLNAAINDSLSREQKKKERVIDGHLIVLDAYDIRRDNDNKVYYAHECKRPHCGITVRRYIVHYESDRSCDESKFKNLLK